jgi:hypothetical protein
MFDDFSRRDIRDLRNMREHVVDYFEGYGRDSDRWQFETPEFKADASASVGTLIGGRLDWKLFAAAAETLLPALLSDPILRHPRTARPPDAPVTSKIFGLLVLRYLTRNRQARLVAQSHLVTAQPRRTDRGPWKVGDVATRHVGSSG